MTTSGTRSQPVGPSCDELRVQCNAALPDFPLWIIAWSCLHPDQTSIS